MSVSCGRRIDALWCSEHNANAWVWLRGSGWRKLDDRNADSCTNLLAIAAMEGNGYRSRSMKKSATVIPSSPRFTTSLTVSSAQFRKSATTSRSARSIGRPPTPARHYITVRIRLDPDPDQRDDDDDPARPVAHRHRKKWTDRFGCCPARAASGGVRSTSTSTGSPPTNTTACASEDQTKQHELWHTTNSGNVASHEFGHMLGHPDEYSTSACPRRSPVNTGTVIDNDAEVVHRLCTPFCDRHGLTTYQCNHGKNLKAIPRRPTANATSPIASGCGRSAISVRIDGGPRGQESAFTSRWPPAVRCCCTTNQISPAVRSTNLERPLRPPNSTA